MNSVTRVFEPFPYLHLLTELTELTELTTELNELTELSVLPELTELTELIELTELTELTKNCIYWKSEKVSPTYSLTDNLKSRDASASENDLKILKAIGMSRPVVGVQWMPHKLMRPSNESSKLGLI